MLVVTGASGKLGGLVLEALLRLVPAEQIGVSVREPEKLSHLAARGVRVRKGDYNDADSLRSAWDGAARLLLVSSNAAASGGNALAQHETAIAVAKELGVKRLLYTSQVSSNSQSHFPPGRDHAATEAMLAQSGLAWTALRHGFYADSAISMHARGLESRCLTGPEDGKVAWTTHQDLAEVDALFLSGHETREGPTSPLVGSEALDMGDLARLAGEIVGQSIERCIISEDTMVKTARDHGIPESVIRVMTGYYRAAREGEFAMIDPTLKRLLGREPERIKDLLARKFG
ncbi:Uncharacterized conserved protein YbjT, contains NAD(P)-binding and DUF2867 domains [Cohaesibacter marisflavi]|uniref:Uncharacterized conserved protein YbjT, contains NAD(P)-binding and DUF2867 domains n=1 Tax=Cohaesibacter marisflavi TaxID=655353 RepID=A0A1I5MML6_9HYPH|nr:NAD(P)H-binding protein [Cohaesibacter marisflavi]SFP10161.1 Uncharacterized conserved protein YbjT, contains NAD(P)-binding and DUF2867 domains [Cohaesibacter marisflavi]